MPREYLPNCLQCGTELGPDRHAGRPIKKFCSPKCGTIWRNSRPEMEAVRKKASKAAGKVHRKRSKKLHPGTPSRVKIKVGERRILRYRYLMEKQIGRKLREDEIVHHINEDHQDDRLENLMVLTRAEHARLHNLLRGR